MRTYHANARRPGNGALVRHKGTKRKADLPRCSDGCDLAAGHGGFCWDFSRAEHPHFCDCDRCLNGRRLGIGAT